MLFLRYISQKNILTLCCHHEVDSILLRIEKVDAVQIKHWRWIAFPELYSSKENLIHTFWNITTKLEKGSKFKR
jgi:hypothetical protein